MPEILIKKEYPLKRLPLKPNIIHVMIIVIVILNMHTRLAFCVTGVDHLHHGIILQII